MSGAHIPLPRSLWLRLLTRCLRSGLAEVLTRTFVPIELCLQIRLGVLDSRQRAQGSLEFLATRGAGCHTWHTAQMFDDPKSAFWRESQPLFPTKCGRPTRRVVPLGCVVYVKPQRLSTSVGTCFCSLLRRTHSFSSVESSYSPGSRPSICTK